MDTNENIAEETREMHYSSLTTFFKEICYRGHKITLQRMGTLWYWWISENMNPDGEQNYVLKHNPMSKGFTDSSHALVEAFNWLGRNGYQTSVGNAVE